MHTETYHSHTQGNHQEDVQAEVDEILCNAGRQRRPAALHALSECFGDCHLAADFPQTRCWWPSLSPFSVCEAAGHQARCALQGTCAEVAHTQPDTLHAVSMARFSIVAI